MRFRMVERDLWRELFMMARLGVPMLLRAITAVISNSQGTIEGLHVKAQRTGQVLWDA